MKYTYLMEPEKVQEELDKYRKRYQIIINQEKPTREEMNEARAILFLTGNLYCEQVAVGAIERRLHLLLEPFSLIDFFNTLEKYYEVIKKYKNRCIEGKYYLEEEKFLQRYNKMSPNPDMRIGYK